jgi:hypothetical protein
MKISISDLKTERQWRSSTGYDQKRFTELLVIFERKYQEIFQEKMEDIKARSPMQSSIKNCEELLFFTLFSLKSGLTYDVLGLVTGMDGATAKRNQEVGILVLKAVFQETGDAPKREFKTVKEFESFFKQDEVLIIDGTEQYIERPQNKDKQKQNYSGKKKLTPLKRLSSRMRKSGSAS